MIRYLLGIALAGATMTLAPVSAFAETNGAVELQRGDFASAERVIVEQLRMWPGDTDLLLNLATVYRMTGRTADARKTYQAVLTAPDEELDMRDKAVRSAHAVAQAGLRTLERAQISAR